jgi:hypothetical protein
MEGTDGKALRLRFLTRKVEVEGGSGPGVLSEKLELPVDFGADLGGDPKQSR